MPNRREHNKKCVEEGFNEDICNEINKEMDSTKGRNHRKDKVHRNCKRYKKKANGVEICEFHQKLDEERSASKKDLKIRMRKFRK